jgi:hypothetical protein
MPAPKGIGDDPPHPHGDPLAWAHVTPDVPAAESAPDQDFWDARPALRHIRAFAYARLCSPWAVLGAALLHALHCVPPWVTLPPLIGGRGSLNLFVAQVGPPGSGKGAAEAAAAEAFDMHGEPVYVAALGSGEGITHQYAHHTNREIVHDRNAVIFTAAEIDGLTALQARQGSTLTPQLRSAFNGERLGFSYADPSRRIPLGAHSYRLGLLAGVQPERAAPLLDQTDGGTPQRFIWLPSTDPTLTADTPPAPLPMRITATRGSWKTGNLQVPDQVAVEIRNAHVSRARGDGHALDGHALFAREKVAYALALLDDRREMNLEDWQLGGQIMIKSDHTRASVAATLQRKTREAENARAIGEGRRDVIRGRVVADDELQRACQAIIRKLGRERGWVAGKIVRRAVTSRLRKCFDDAVDKLAETGQIEAENVEHNGQQGRQLRLAERAR